MSIDAEVLQKIKESPRLALYAQEIEKVLEAEAKSRQQFYEQISEDDKAEFINGEIIIHSPVKWRHNQVSVNLLMLIRAYVAKQGLGMIGHEKIMVSLTRNDYEPDICFFHKSKSEQFTDDQMRFPAPDFIAEVLSASTETNDRGIKFDDYAAHGVEEYWIVDPQEQFVEQYWLRDDAYELVIKANNGRLTSRAIPGFSIPIQAIFDQELNQSVIGELLTAH